MFMGCLCAALVLAPRPAVTALAVTPDGQGLVRGSQAGVTWQDFAGKDQAALAVELDHVFGLAFAPDGKTLAIAGGSPGARGRVELWSWPERRRLTKREDHADVVYATAWLRGGLLATASADRTVRIWDTAKGQAVATLRGHSGPVLTLAVTPDGKWLCSGSSDQTIRVWSTATWQTARTLDNHLGPVQQLTFRPAVDGAQPALLASASDDGTVRVWQPTIGRMVRSIKHPGPVTCVAWSADGQGLLTGGKDGKLRTLDHGTDQFSRTEQLSPGGLTGLVAPAGKRRAIVGDARGQVLVVD